MAISFGCPSCNAPFKVGEELAGKKVKCPKCENVFRVPGSAAAPAPAPAPKPKAPAAPPSEVKEKVQAAETYKSTRKAVVRDDDRDERRDDDRPAPKRRRAGGAKRSVVPMVLFGVGSALVLLAFCGGAGTALWAWMDDAPRVANNQPFIPPRNFNPGMAPMPGPGGMMGGPGMGMPPMPGGAGHGGVAAGGQKISLVNGSFQIQAQLVANDPPDPTFPARRVKRYLVDLQPGKSYTIDQRSDEFDAFLKVLDASGTMLAVDDDGGGDLNSRIVFSPPRAETYVVVATSLDAELGNFSLSIREGGIRLKK